jgi:TatA/E family protein of Tat protein translocase
VYHRGWWIAGLTFLASRQIIEGKDECAMIGSLGMPELLFIMVLALLIFGPRKLPEIGKTMGKAMGEFRRATRELKRTLDTEISAEEVSGPANPAQVNPAPAVETPPIPPTTSPPVPPATQAPAPPEGAVVADPTPTAEPSREPE